MREVRGTQQACLENGHGAHKGQKPHPTYAEYGHADLPPLYPAPTARDRADLQPEGLIAAIENMPPGGGASSYYLGIDFVRKPTDPKDEIRVQKDR